MFLNISIKAGYTLDYSVAVIGRTVLTGLFWFGSIPRRRLTFNFKFNVAFLQVFVRRRRLEDRLEINVTIRKPSGYWLFDFLALFFIHSKHLGF